MKKRTVVLDTSFWTALVYVNMADYLQEFFELPILVPESVRDEVLDSRNARKQRIYPYQQEFETQTKKGHFEIVSVKYRIPNFDHGEARAIALAYNRSVEQSNSTLLINESKSYQFAHTELGVFCLSVPGFLVLLAQQGLIEPGRASDRLARLSESSSDEVIGEAQNHLSQI